MRGKEKEEKRGPGDGRGGVVAVFAVFRSCRGEGWARGPGREKIVENRFENRLKIPESRIKIATGPVQAVENGKPKMCCSILRKKKAGRGRGLTTQSVAKIQS